MDPASVPESPALAPPEPPELLEAEAKLLEAETELAEPMLEPAEPELASRFAPELEGEPVVAPELEPPFATLPDGGADP